MKHFRGVFIDESPFLMQRKRLWRLQRQQHHTEPLRSRRGPVDVPPDPTCCLMCVAAARKGHRGCDLSPKQIRDTSMLLESALDKRFYPEIHTAAFNDAAVCIRRAGEFNVMTVI